MRKLSALLRLASYGAQPGAAGEADLWWDSTLHRARAYDGTTQRQIAFASESLPVTSAAQSGEYIQPRNCTQTAGLIRTATNLGETQWVPISLDRVTSISNIGCYVNVAAAGGTALNWYFAIAADDGTDTRPAAGNVLFSSAAVAIGTTTGAKLATVGQSFGPASTLWLGCKYSYTGAPTTHPTPLVVNQGLLLPSTTMNNPIRGWSQAGTAGAITSVGTLTLAGTPIFTCVQRT